MTATHYVAPMHFVSVKVAYYDNLKCDAYRTNTHATYFYSQYLNVWLEGCLGQEKLIQSKERDNYLNSIKHEFSLSKLKFIYVSRGVLRVKNSNFMEKWERNKIFVQKKVSFRWRELHKNECVIDQKLHKNLERTFKNYEKIFGMFKFLKRNFIEDIIFSVMKVVLQIA